MLALAAAAVGVAARQPSLRQAAPKDEAHLLQLRPDPAVLFAVNLQLLLDRPGVGLYIHGILPYYIR